MIVTTFKLLKFQISKNRYSMTKFSFKFDLYKRYKSNKEMSLIHSLEHTHIVTVMHVTLRMKKIPQKGSRKKVIEKKEGEKKLQTKMSTDA